MAEDGKLDRRGVLGLGAVLGAGAAVAHDGMLGAPPETITNAMPWRDGQTDAPDGGVSAEGWRYLDAGEVAFLTAIVDRLIPPDETGPSASQAGVVTFLDRQLAGAYGQGSHFYLAGPWGKGTPEQGYQSRFGPAAFYRHAITAVQQAVAARFAGRAFQTLDAAAQDAIITEMELGTLALQGAITAKNFFTQLHQNVLEGYFSDPIYGGNRNGAAWTMIGFPGAHYDYSPWVGAYNQRIPVKTVGLRGRADWSRG